MYLFWQSVPNGLENCLPVTRYIVIPQANDFVSFGFQELGPHLIIFGLMQMLAAIQFENELLACGTKVNNKISYSVLRSEVGTFHAVGAKTSP